MSIYSKIRDIQAVYFGVGLMKHVRGASAPSCQWVSVGEID